MSRVLVVDDDEGERRALSRVLRRAGHDVVEAASVREAEALVAASRFDVVLLDLFMPERDGAQLLPVLEKLVPQPGVAVVSGRVDERRSVAVRWPGLMVLEKPVPADLLCQAVALLAAPAEEAALDDFAAKKRFTPREAQVFKLVYARLSTDEISARLSCAASTVCSYYSRIEAKTACHSLADVLAAFAQFVGRRRITPPRDLPSVK